MENTLIAKGNYMLIATDGYSLDDYTFYDTLKDAQTAMKKAYDQTIPEDWDESDMEMSFCNDQGAMLYNNGEDVFVWNIIKITK